MLHRCQLIGLLLASLVMAVSCGDDTKDSEKTRGRKSGKSSATKDDREGPGNNDQAARAGGGVTLVGSKPEGRTATTVGAPASAGPAAGVGAPGGGSPLPPGAGAAPLPPGTPLPTPGAGAPPLPPGAGSTTPPIAPPGPPMTLGDPKTCSDLEERFQRCKKEATALFNQLNQGQREVSRLGGKLEDELPKEAGVAVPDASEYSIPPKYKKYFKKKLKEPCLAGVPVEKLDMVITECKHIKDDLQKKIALNEKYTRVLRGTIQDVKEAKRALMAYANRAYAATALGSWQDANACIAKMKGIDKKWTGGRGVSRLTGQLSKQQVREPIQYGYQKCLEGNHHEGKQAYDYAKRQGADGRAISYLKRKCGQRLSYSPCK